MQPVERGHAHGHLATQQQRYKAHAEARFLESGEGLVAETRRIAQPGLPDFDRQPREQADREIPLDDEFAAGRALHLGRNRVPVVVRVEQQIQGNRGNHQDRHDPENDVKEFFHRAAPGMSSRIRAL